jgi:hypothetical protein
MTFTGKEIHAFGREIPATCIVRNELNGWRKPHQIIRTTGTTHPHGLAYYPRPFPAGEWDIMAPIPVDDGSQYWPYFIPTTATAELEAWDIKDGKYDKPSGRTFVGRGYGLHHARFRRDGEMVFSTTTFGCINILNPQDVLFLVDKLRDAGPVKLTVPPWEQWV